MSDHVFTDPLTQPTEEAINRMIGESAAVYRALCGLMPSLGLVASWNYYRDGKAWLCKVEHRRKTVFWLSVLPNCFTVTFYFTAKSSEGLCALTIDEKIKASFRQSRALGRLLPLTLSMLRLDQLDDLLKIIAYKRSIR